MSIKRMDHVSAVVTDIEAATAFFSELGMEPEGEKATVRGAWVDRLTGLEDVQVEIAMMKTPDGHGRVELTQFRNPQLVATEPAIMPPNTIGWRTVMFAVDDVHETVARLRTRGGELIGEIERYEDFYLLCYLRGPGGVIVALAQEL